jgi:hypothetical protein
VAYVSRYHREALAAMDFFPVPTVTFKVQYRYLIFDHDAKFDEDVIAVLKGTGLNVNRTSTQAP